MSKYKNIFNMACVASMSAASMAVPSTASAASIAQDNAPPSKDARAIDEEATLAGNEIVVTAARRAQSLQDVPMSIDVATGEQIQHLNMFDAKDIQQLSPGLELTNFSGRNNTATLRAFSDHAGS